MVNLEPTERLGLGPFLGPVNLRRESTALSGDTFGDTLYLTFLLLCASLCNFAYGFILLILNTINEFMRHPASSCNVPRIGLKIRRQSISVPESQCSRNEFQSSRFQTHDPSKPELAGNECRGLREVGRRSTELILLAMVANVSCPI